MADEVEKVTGDGGANQPDSAETQDSAQNETQDGAEQGSADQGTAEQGTTDQGTTDPKKKDNGKVNFPIADAQYRNAEGAVVTAATTEKVTAEDGSSSDVAKLLAVPRPIFDEAGEVDETTGKKPVLYAGWNHRKHNPLKKDDFVNEAEFINYQAFTFRIKAAVFMEKAKVAEKRAARLKKFGNEKQRKDVNKALKMREALAKYTKMLEAQGISLDDLDD